MQPTRSPSASLRPTRPTPPLFRLVVDPSERNGLRATCRLMVDKITTVPKAKMGMQIGRLDDEDMLRLNRAMTVFLGMAASPRNAGGTLSTSSPGFPNLPHGS